jgi:PAT family beta-lactamase induction signal transducer AmpG
LTEHEQAAFSGVRNTFYRVAMIGAQGQLVVLAGKIHERHGELRHGLVSGVRAGRRGFFYCWPFITAGGCRSRRTTGRAVQPREKLAANFSGTFTAFFQKPNIGTLLAFMLLYRLGEAQLLPVAKFFLLDAARERRPGIVGRPVRLAVRPPSASARFMCGGLLGGWVVSRRGLKFWLWPMLLAIHLPDAVFIWLAAAQPQNLFAIGAASPSSSSATVSASRRSCFT